MLRRGAPLERKSTASAGSAPTCNTSGRFLVYHNVCMSFFLLSILCILPLGGLR